MDCNSTMNAGKPFSRIAFTAIILATLITNISRAQVKKFGDISAEDFTAYDAEYDSSMSAVVLFEFGEYYFDRDYNCYTDIHKRIKVLNDDALDYGDIQILYRKDYEQSVDHIKAMTYNLNEKGELEKSKLGKKEVFDQGIRDDIRIKKFSMPDVKAGSIIEYSYRKKIGSPFLMPDWKFHDYIPVMWSELVLKVPIQLEYRIIFKGSEDLFISEADLGTSMSGKYKIYRLAKKDLPAVEDLPFLYNREDHVSEVKTQLIKARVNGNLPQNFFEDWDAIAKDMNDRGDFGKQRANKEIKRKVEELVTEEMDELEKVKVIYDYLVSNIHWDGFNSVITKKGIRDTFEEMRGNTGDINLLLVEMLKEAGVQANPALVSTSGNGAVLVDFPLINQFNSVIAVVEIGQSAFMLDASSGHRSYRVQNPKFLNRNAFVIREDNSYGWLFTQPIERTSERISLQYSLADSGSYKVEMLGYASGAYAQNYRNEVDSTDAHTFWRNEIERWDDFEVDSAQFGELENVEEDVSFSAQFNVLKKDEFTLDDEIIYHNPFIGLSTFENPFIKEKRAFRVEFPFAFKDETVLNLILPKGYEIEDFPDSYTVNLPENYGYFRFVVGKYQDKLSVYSNLFINNYYVPKEYYTELRDMFMKYEELHNSVLVLKKIEE